MVKCKCGCGKDVIYKDREYTLGHNPNSGFKKGHKINLGIERLDMKEKHLSKKTEFKEGHIPWTKGKRKKDYPQMTNKSKLGQHPTKESEKKRIKKLKKTIKKRGYKTKENSRARLSEKINLWRLKVFERDNYTCQDCKKSGCYLEAHHIKSWAKYPKLRFKTSNGRTLCLKCHKKTKNYKGKGR